MKPTLQPDYDQIQSVLDHTHNKLNPSQAHGLICGTLCRSENNIGWEKSITGDDVVSPTTHQVLEELYHTAALQLKDFAFDFQLLLPLEEEPLPVRAEALTLWCQGFLTGLQIVGIQITDRDASETTEAINDLIEIAKMNYEDVVATEEDEEAFTELVEYVRVAIILIYEDMHVDESKESTEKRSVKNKHLH